MRSANGENVSYANLKTQVAQLALFAKQQQVKIPREYESEENQQEVRTKTAFKKIEQLEAKNAQLEQRYYFCQFSCSGSTTYHVQSRPFTARCWFFWRLFFSFKGFSISYISL